MAQLKWWLGVASVVGLSGACSSDPGTGSPILNPQAGAGGAVTAGAGGVSAGAGAGGATAGASSGGAPAGGGPATCTPACTAEQACLGGQCLPKPTELTRIEGCGNMNLAVSKGTLYFTDGAHGNVKSIPVAGGTATDVATGQKAPYAIAVDDAGVVYWSNSSATVTTDNTLMMKAPTGTPTKITDVNQAGASPTNIAKSIALDGTGSLYYGAKSDLMKVQAMANATPTKVGTFSGVPTAIVLTPAPPTATTRVFTTLDVANAVEWRNPDPATSGCTDPITRPEPVDGETAEQKTARVNGSGCSFSQSVGNLLFEALSLSGTNILFADRSSIQIADTTVAATTQAMRKTVAETDSFDSVSGLTSSATTVYFGEATTGIIEKAALPLGAPVILVQDPTQVSPSSFVTDGTNLYWRTGAAAADACAIMKLPL